MHVGSSVFLIGVDKDLSSTISQRRETNFITDVIFVYMNAPVSNFLRRSKSYDLPFYLSAADVLLAKHPQNPA